MKHYPILLHALLFLCLTALSACDSKQQPGGNNPFERTTSGTSEAQYESYEEMMADSISQTENVDMECARLCEQIDMLSERLQRVKSPDGLIPAKREYADLMSKFKKEMAGLGGDELDAAKKRIQQAEETYKKTCREYEVPASGVIANLRNLTERLDKIDKREDFIRFQDVRIGMLNSLDYIHLCVEQNSNAISEVKRLAIILKNKYDTKKHEFGFE